MKKVAVVYWSGTGNTEKMAELVAQGAKDKGAEVDTMTCSEFTPDKVSNYDGIAFGCPSMGAEVLEEEFQPMWDRVKESLEGKSIVLFGSYDWGDGEWMRNWEEEGFGNILGSYICHEPPGSEEEEECKALGGKLG